MSRKSCALLLLLGTGVAARSQQTIGTGLPLPNGLHALAPQGFPLVFSNPACRDSGFFFATSASRLHNMRGLGHRFAGLAFDAGSLRWSVSVLQDGSRHFYRQQIGFSLANRIARHTVLGIGLIAEGVRQSSMYPERGRTFLRSGLLTRIGRKTELGMRLHTGIAGPPSGSLPQTWHLALGHRVADNLQLFAELEAQSGTAAGPASLKTALCYFPEKRFSLMLGTGGKLRPYSLALAWHRGGLRSALGFDFHRSLGFTPQVLLVWKGKS